jgi:uncharacterized RDD family membrane protein YckC
MEAGSSPERPLGPQAPAPESPPGGWQQPIPRPASGWEGRPLASWGSRVGAQLIDWVVLLIPAVVLFILIVAGLDDPEWWETVAATILYVVVMAAVLLLYAPLLMMRKGEHNGQTLGKQAVGITVVRDNGEPLGFGWSAFREVLVKGLAVGIASTIIPLVPWLLDNLWPLWDDQNRALHDMACQTHVVRV